MSGPLIPDQVIHVAASPPATPQKAAAYIRISPARYDAVCRKVLDACPGVRERFPGVLCLRSGILRVALGHACIADIQGATNMVGIARDEELGDDQMCVRMCVPGFAANARTEIGSRFPARPECVEVGPGQMMPNGIVASSFMGEPVVLAAAPMFAPYADAVADLSSFGLLPDPKASPPGKRPAGPGMCAVAPPPPRMVADKAGVAPPQAARPEKAAGSPGTHSRVCRRAPAWVWLRGGDLLEWTRGEPSRIVPLAVGTRVMIGGHIFRVTGTVVGDGGPIRGVVVNYADAREAVGAAVNAGGWESCGLIDRDFTLAVESAARAYATGDR